MLLLQRVHRVSSKVVRGGEWKRVRTFSICFLSSSKRCASYGLARCILFLGTSLLQLVFPVVHAIEYRHGFAFLDEPGLPADFTHTRYVNPDALKGGVIRIAEMGTWDSFNPLALTGREVKGVAFWVPQDNWLFATLMQPALDEPTTMYANLADGIAVDPEGAWVGFRLRADATWHDGKPITVDDVVWSFDVFRNKATPTVSTPLQVFSRIEVTGDREFRFIIEESARGDAVLPRRAALLPILPKHWWEGRDVTRGTTEAPIGSGPYRVGRFSIGRWVEWERVPGWWGEKVPINRGRYNFDRIKVDYFRDDQVQTEAVKGHEVDVRFETVPSTWATGYDTPAVRQGFLRKAEFTISRPGGLWWPIFWNLEQARFQDIRVREALWLMSDGEWSNKRSWGFWGLPTSFFHGSELAATGLPNELELRLLEPLREQVPPRVFTEPFKLPPNQGGGWHRENLLRAEALLREAGWVIEGDQLVHSETREPFHVRFVAVSASLGGSFIPYTNKLKRLGITSNIKAPEVSNWLFRMRSGDFDAGAIWFLPDFTPTLLVSNTFHSSGADQAYSGNWSNLRDPAVDALIEHMYKAKSWDEFVAATRALDRVLLWNFYFVAVMSKTKNALAWWDKFGMPEHGILNREVVYHDLWWWDEPKTARVREFLGER